MNTWILRALLCLLCGISGYSSNAQSTPDPGLPGTYAVSVAAYNLGDRGDTLPSIGPVEFRGSVHYPTGLSGGPFPVLLLLHGRHLTCYKTSDPSSVSMAWPPPAGYQSITSFEGYDYFARLMASHGYIVISISANAINSKDASLADHGMQARAELIQHHLNLWNKYNTTGGAPFGSLFTGKLDLSRIGTMGHSRGGEGVVQQVLHNRIMGSPYGIKAVLTLAPVNFQRRKLNGVPILNIAPYCDGDVSGLDGVHYYDDVRYNDTTDTTAKYSVMMTGANHNYFNTVWTPGAYIAGTSDDWFIGSDPHCSVTMPGNKRFTAVQQKATFAAYAAAFFRTYLEHDNRFAPILETDDLQPPASTGVDSSAIFVSYHPAPDKRRDINRTDALPKAGTNDLGGRVSSAGIAAANICGAGLAVPDCVSSISDMQLPHRGTGITPGLGVMNLKWDDDTDYYENEIPAAYQDISRYKDLQFRVAVNFVAAPAAATPDFKIQLTDASGLVSSRQASAHTHALVYPPGWTGTVTWGIVPKMMSHTVKVPLSAFKGINQEAIRKLRILFDGPSSGAVLLSEFCFSGDALSSPCDSVIAGFGYKEAATYHLLFTDSTKTGTGDTLSWFWRFGDPASGTADTSSLQHPEHTYPGPGVYRVCLYTGTKTTAGMICTDSVCKNISVLPTGIYDPAAEQLMLVPNPAKDVLQVYGAGPGSSLQLLNLYGQTVFRAAATGLIQLPQSLAPGVYLALVKKQDGRTLVQRLVINR